MCDERTAKEEVLFLKGMLSGCDERSVRIMSIVYLKLTFRIVYYA